MVINWQPRETGQLCAVGDQRRWVCWRVRADEVQMPQLPLTLPPRLPGAAEAVSEVGTIFII